MPEKYAAIVLTSRMDNELRKMIKRVLHRQGDAEELLFDFNMAFGTFSAKAAAAYSFGFITKRDCRRDYELSKDSQRLRPRRRSG